MLPQFSYTERARAQRTHERDRVNVDHWLGSIEKFSPSRTGQDPLPINIFAMTRIRDHRTVAGSLSLIFASPLHISPLGFFFFDSLAIGGTQRWYDGYLNSNLGHLFVFVFFPEFRSRRWKG